MSAREEVSPGDPDGPEVGTGIRAPGGVWTFGGRTPAAFDDHVRRSVPGYSACHELILDIADQLCPANGRCYDLGCSIGTLTKRLSERLAPRGAEVIGVDRDPEMIARASRGHAVNPSLRFLVSAIEAMKFEPADLIVCFYTLQFTAFRDRLPLLTRLRHALEPHGALILFEKTVATSGREQDLVEGAYLEFKRRNGFSNSEIVEKGRSLRGILRPLSASENHALLHEAGFGEIMHVFRWLMFDGVIAWPSAT